MPPIVLTIISLVQLASKAGPAAQEIYVQARALIGWLFNGGMITIAQQLELRTWADAHEAATLAGEVPPELTVEADPKK